MKHIDHFINMRMADHGLDLSRQQVILLKILHYEGPQSQNSLACVTDRDKTSLTRLLSTMEKKNLVARIGSQQDKRVNMIHLTKRGEQVLKEVEPILTELIGEMQEGIDENDQRTVIEVMKKLQDNIENHITGCNTNN